MWGRPPAPRADGRTRRSWHRKNFLQNAFAGASLKIGITSWIGLTDEDIEGVFRWSTGPDVGQLLGCADWRTGEPNNTGNEDYVTWENYPLGPDGGAWNDANPKERVFRFMVEFGPQSVPEPPALGLLCLGRCCNVRWIAGGEVSES